MERVMKSIIASLTVIGVAVGLGAHAEGVHAVKTLDGYQCMSLAKLWDGEGPQPAPVNVYDAAGPQAAKVGFAAATVIAPSPLKVEDGRIPIIWPNGRTVWINQIDVVPWHVVSDPHASCTPVMLSNGRYGFDGKR
jgi:hypothetical protein